VRLKVAPPAAQVGALAFLAGEGEPEDAAPEPRGEEREADHCSPVELGDGGFSAVGAFPPPPPPSRNNWTRLVPLPVLTGRVS